MGFKTTKTISVAFFSIIALLTLISFQNCGQHQSASDVNEANGQFAAGLTATQLPNCQAYVESASGRTMSNGAFPHNEKFRIKIYPPSESSTAFYNKRLEAIFYGSRTNMDGTGIEFNTFTKPLSVSRGNASYTHDIYSDSQFLQGINSRYMRINSIEADGSRRGVCVAWGSIRYNYTTKTTSVSELKFSVLPPCGEALVGSIGRLYNLYYRKYLSTDLNNRYVSLTTYDMLRMGFNSTQVGGKGGVARSLASIKWSGTKYGVVDEVDAEYVPISSYPLNIGPFTDQEVGDYTRTYKAYDSSGALLCAAPNSPRIIISSPNCSTYVCP